MDNSTKLKSLLKTGPDCGDPLPPEECHRCKSPKPRHVTEYVGCGCVVPTCCACLHSGRNHNE